MHPAHEKYFRTPPTSTLQELFRLLDGMEYDLREEILLRASEVIDPVIDHHLLGEQPIYLVFREACQRLAAAYPEDIVVQHIVGHTLWLLLHYSDPDKRRRHRSRDARDSESRQLALFVTAPVERESQTTGFDDPIYDSFCEQVVKPLLGHKSDRNATSEEEDLAFLALCEMRGVGYWTLRKLVRNGLLRYLFHLESQDEFYRCIASAGAKGIEQNFDSDPQWRTRLFDRGRSLRELLHSQGISLVTQSSSSFPRSLREIDDPPLWLFVEGSVAPLRGRSVAVVGTRHPTQDGLRLAEIVGRCIPEFESVIVSGLAEGIDQAMHLNSINSHVETIAVLGTGILKNYPAGSEPLRQEICAKGGAVVTEYLPRDSYSSKNFVRRNRIQAGLASVVIPVEWREKSGTAHTVRYAYEAKRTIVCPRLSHWRSDMHSELLVAERMGAHIYTLPDQQADFIQAVRQKEGG